MHWDLLAVYENRVHTLTRYRLHTSSVLSSAVAFINLSRIILIGLFRVRACCVCVCVWAHTAALEPAVGAVSLIVYKLVPSAHHHFAYYIRPTWIYDCFRILSNYMKIVYFTSRTMPTNDFMGDGDGIIHECELFFFTNFSNFFTPPKSPSARCSLR